MVVLTSSLSAIPCPCRTEEKNSTRGWLGCSSELCHKSNWTFLNICCGWLAPWLAEFDRREWEPVCLGLVCMCVCTQRLADLRMRILHIYFVLFFSSARERESRREWERERERKRNKLIIPRTCYRTCYIGTVLWECLLVSRSHFFFFCYTNWILNTHRTSKVESGTLDMLFLVQLRISLCTIFHLGPLRGSRQKRHNGEWRMHNITCTPQFLPACRCTTKLFLIGQGS